MTGRPYDEHEGRFESPSVSPFPCPRCGGEMECRLWCSDDGSFEDEKHKCRACGHVVWVEGIDS